MKKILVVDDEPLVRRSLKRVLASAGYEVVEASDGREGLMQWRKIKPDLVFLDILMPGLTGPQVLTEIEAEIRDLSKVIFISAYTGEYNLESAKSLGADLFLAKPFDDVFQIVELVSQVLK
jgi:CheY-like chemotaxis protein